MSRSSTQAIWKSVGNLALGAFALIPVGQSGAALGQSLPRPALQFKGFENYSAGGKDWVRYRLDVSNSSEFDAALFLPAPDLAPCGSNKNSSRTWVDIFAKDGKRIYGFCALGKTDNLNSIWFATEAGVEPPRWVYVEIHDRKTGATQRSNLALIP